MCCSREPGSWTPGGRLAAAASRSASGRRSRSIISALNNSSLLASSNRRRRSCGPRDRRHRSGTPLETPLRRRHRQPRPSCGDASAPALPRASGAAVPPAQLASRLPSFPDLGASRLARTTTRWSSSPPKTWPAETRGYRSSTGRACASACSEVISRPCASCACSRIFEISSPSGPRAVHPQSHVASRSSAIA
jgi:hypothetical protein